MTLEEQAKKDYETSVAHCDDALDYYHANLTNATNQLAKARDNFRKAYSAKMRLWFELLNVRDKIGSIDRIDDNFKAVSVA